MINTLHKELRAIALSILDQGNMVNVEELEQKVRELQKQLTILEHEQRMSKQEVVEVPLAVVEELEIRNEEPKVVVETVPEKQLETLEVSEESPQVVTETLEDLFATAISEPVFVKKESPALEEEAGVEQNPKNLNDVLGKGLKIGLNDRLAFIKNLFDEQPEEYQRVISQILTYENLDEAQEFIETFVKPEYNSWEGKESFEDRFYKIIEQNFN
ncbi:hypothetical protein OAB54_01450 [Flavobacteriaceae bacterium]|nr:hypothetical protein [Flavobacteriaceae bacterium]